MSKYFKPVEFPEEPNPAAKPVFKPEFVFNKTKVKEATQAIRDESEKVKVADNGYTHYGIDPGKGGFVALFSRLTIFENDPTQKNLDGVVQIAMQDISAKFALFAKDTLDATKEKNDE